MATIELYANKINQMPGLIKDVKKSVTDYKSELSALKTKSLSINKSVCNLDNIISSIQTSSQTQEQKITSLETLSNNSEEFISDATRIDGDAADIIKKRKDDFYDKYNYLKPECEKDDWEKFCDGCKAVGEWCKEHWKLIVTVIIVIAAIVVIVFFPAAAPILLLAAKGAIVGALTGGVMGGMSSLAGGGSFFEGFEDGAFTGAITGAIFGAIGGAGQMLGSSCKVLGKIGNFAKIIPHIAKISGGITAVMGGFDLLSFGIGLLDPSNPIVALNQKLHSSKLYNVFQISVSALAVLTAGFSVGMKNPVCFVAGTMILTATGLVAIENIRAGDKVISTNEKTFETTEKEVLETFSLSSNSLVHIWINGKKTSVTPNHPYWVVNKGWINAGDLAVGEQLRKSNGDLADIQKIEHEELGESVKVFNFKVEDYHTYYAGNISVLVHNSDCAPRKPIKGVTKTEVHEDGSVTYTKKINGQEVKVTYNSDGYPDFSPYAHPEYPNPVKIEYSGNRTTDYLRANQQAGLSSTPKGFTWHHMQDGQSMLLVNETIHGTKFGFSHTGGFSINQVTN